MDNSTGNYDFNFTNAMENEYYGHTSVANKVASNNCTNNNSTADVTNSMSDTITLVDNCSVAIQEDLA